jgi:hypothetical protein
VRRGSAPAVGDEARARLHRDGGYRRACAGSRALYPVGRRAGEEQRGEREDRDEPRPDEADAADERPEPAAQPPRAEDGELRRSRAGEEVARGDRVLEVARREPAAPLDAQLPEQRDVRRRPPEADAPDSTPLARDREEPRLLVYATFSRNARTRCRIVVAALSS